MDRKAFELGYLLGHALSRVEAEDIVAATRGVEAALRRILVVDEVFRAELETIPPDELKEMPFVLLGEGRVYWLPYYRRAWVVFVELPRSAEQAYEDAIRHVAIIQETMEKSGLHEVIAHLAQATPEGYGAEREWPPPDILRLAESLGVSIEDTAELVGGRLSPQEAIAEVGQRGSRNVFALLLRMPNPFTIFSNRIWRFKRELSLERVRSLWPRREGWGAALGGAILVGADIVAAVEGVLEGPSLGGIAASIATVYSVPEGCARIRRGVERMRVQEEHRQ